MESKPFIIEADRERIRSHAAVLCEEIGARIAGSEEEKKAASYAEDVFRSYGARVSVEDFPILKREVKRQELRIKIKGQWKSYPCSLLGASPGTGNERLTAPIIFFETAAEYARKDLSRLKDRAVVHIGTQIESRECYKRLMEAHPAFLLFVDIRFPGKVPTADGLLPSYVTGIGAVPSASVAYFDAWEWMKEGAAEAELFVEGGSVPGVSRNVIADFPGSDPDSGIIYTGSHIDTQADSAGADDNASGMVFQFELARILSAVRLKRTVRHIAFGTEEQLSVGSASYVRRHREEVERRGLFMFNADSCGSILGWTAVNFNGPEEMKVLTEQFFKDRDMYFTSSNDIIPYTDQFPFAVCGVPGLWLSRPNCTAGTFYHHRPENDIGKLSFDIIAKYAEAAAGLIARIASEENLPFPKEMPAASRTRIEAVWKDLFGGWEE
jgi:hypothetical protein